VDFTSPTRVARVASAPNTTGPSEDVLKPIVTLTLNSSIDLAFMAGEIDPGGGAINVARVIKELGAEAHIIYMAGGATGLGISRQFVDIAGDWRISFMALEDICLLAQGPRPPLNDLTLQLEPWRAHPFSRLYVRQPGIDSSGRWRRDHQWRVVSRVGPAARSSSASRKASLQKADSGRALEDIPIDQILRPHAGLLGAALYEEPD